MTLRRFLAIVGESACPNGQAAVEWVRLRYGAGFEGARCDAVDRGFLAEDAPEGMLGLSASGRSYMRVRDALDGDWAFAGERIDATIQRLCLIVRQLACPKGWADADRVATAYGYGGRGAILVARTIGMLVVANDGRDLQIASTGREIANGT